MSYTYFSADWHLSHNNIIKYCDRPFKDYVHMNDVLIKNANAGMTEDDTFIHVGDFCFRNKTIKQKAKDYEKLINPKLIHVNGNHDRNNSVNNFIEEMRLIASGLHILVRHIPHENPEDFYKMDYYDFVVCGHVHKEWKHKVVYNEDKSRYRIIINVGCDVWKYSPVRLDEVIGYYNQIERELLKNRRKGK